MKPTDIVVTRWGARFMHRRFACAIGRGGITARKREGDGATPAGAHRLVGMLYRADRLAKPAGWALPVGPFDLWSDAPDDTDYNHPVRTPYPHSHERLHRPDRFYDLILLTDWTGRRRNPATARRSSSTSGASPATRPPVASPSRAAIFCGSPPASAPKPGLSSASDPFSQRFEPLRLA